MSPHHYHNHLGNASTRSETPPAKRPARTGRGAGRVSAQHRDGSSGRMAYSLWVPCSHPGAGAAVPQVWSSARGRQPAPSCTERELTADEMVVNDCQGSQPRRRAVLGAATGSLHPLSSHQGLHVTKGSIPLMAPCHQGLCTNESSMSPWALCHQELSSAKSSMPTLCHQRFHVTNGSIPLRVPCHQGIHVTKTSIPPRTSYHQELHATQDSIALRALYHQKLQVTKNSMPLKAPFQQGLHFTNISIPWRTLCHQRTPCHQELDTTESSVPSRAPHH